MRKHRHLTKDEKIEVLKKIAVHIKAGYSKNKAGYMVAGVNGRNCFRWIDTDRELWEIINDEPYPYDGCPINTKLDKFKSTFGWDEAMSRLAKGYTIRPEGSMLYKYRLEGGRLIEYRKSLDSHDWYRSNDITIPEKAYETWKFEVVL